MKGVLTAAWRGGSRDGLAGWRITFQAVRVERLKGLISPESVSTYERLGMLWD